eukprot:TRINITY_DN48324_c0_g1_i1.p1 TRINITY_DN48324_c0_g1~~TRINITY_DN48324_c0_g1_i1.p1  ORF type:complete len:988 (+),score=147.72 TRINITY_DN48324_c0_g1_i1:232-3195(+)
MALRNPHRMATATFESEDEIRKFFPDMFGAIWQWWNSATIGERGFSSVERPNQDSFPIVDEHPSSVLRSQPLLYTSGFEIFVRTFGGTGGQATSSQNGRPSAPSNQTTSIRGFLGVAIQDVATSTWVLSKARKADGWQESGQEIFAFNAAELAPLAGKAITVDVIDEYHGMWGFFLFDQVVTKPQDRNDALTMLREDGMFLRHVSMELRSDREAVLTAVAQNGMSMLYADPCFSEDKEVVMTAVKRHGLSLEFASEELRADRDVVLASVEQSGLALAYCPEELRGDEEMVFAAVQSAGMALCSASDEWRNDEDCVLQAVEQDPLAMEYASTELKGDKRIVMCAVEQDPTTLVYASDELKDDYEVVLPAVRVCGMCLRHCSQRVRRDRDVVLDAVLDDGMSLQFATEKILDDKEAVQTAIKQNGLALQFASARLRHDEDTVYFACKQNPFALEFASMKWRNDQELVFTLVGVDGMVLKHAADLRGDRTICLEAVKQNGLSLGEALHAMRNDPEIVLTAIQQNADSFLVASPELRKDRSLVLAALRMRGTALAHVSDEMIMDHEVLFTSLAQDGMALVYVPDPLRDDHEIVYAAVSQNGMALQYASFRLRCDVEIALGAVGERLEAMEHVPNELQRDEVFMEFVLTKMPDFIKVLASKPGMIARKWAISMARRTLGPQFSELGLRWVDVLPLLKEVVAQGSLASIQAAYERPKEFITALKEKATGSVGRMWAVMQCRPALEPLLTEHDAIWEDFERVLQAYESVEDLHRAVDEPETFLENLEKKTKGLAPMRWLCAKMRNPVTQFLPNGIPFSDVRPILECVDSFRELKALGEAPKHLVYKLSNDRKWTPGIRYIAVALRPELEPTLPAGVIWSDFFKVMLPLDPLNELEETVRDQPKFRKKLRFEADWPPTKYWNIALLRPIVEQRIKEQGGTWDEVLPLLENMDTGYDLQPALDNPGSLLDRLRASASIGPREPAEAAAAATAAMRF